MLDTHPGLIILKKHTMHARQAQLQLGDYYKKAEFLKSKRINELIRQKSQDSRRVLLLPDTDLSTSGAHHQVPLTRINDRC